MALTALAFDLAGGRLTWPSLRRATLLLPAVMLWGLAALAATSAHPAIAWGWMGWLAALVAIYLIVYRQERDHAVLRPDLIHPMNYWIFILLVVWECRWQMAQIGWGDGWQAATLGLSLALGIALPPLLRRLLS